MHGDPAEGEDDEKIAAIWAGAEESIDVVHPAPPPGSTGKTAPEARMAGDKCNI